MPTTSITAVDATVGNIIGTASVTGFLSGLALIVAIGAQNAFVLRQGLRREHVLPTVLVCSVADALLIAGGVAGIGTAIGDNETAMRIATAGGAVFLFSYAALAVRRAARPNTMDPAGQAGTTLAKTLLICAGFTFLNPHVYVDTVVLLGSLAGQHGDDRWNFAVGAMAASICWFTALGYGARSLSRLFARPGAWRVLDGVIAAVMVGLGVMLLA